MKKVVILLSTLLLILLNLNNISIVFANEDYEYDDDHLIENSEQFINVDMEYKENEDGLYDVDEGYESGYTTSSVTSSVVAVWKVVKGASKILGACEVVEYVSDFNPCESAKNVIGESLVGIYEIYATRVDGKDPSCEPSHSYQCNLGYYYKFFYVKGD